MGESEQCYRDALKLEGDHVGSLINLGVVLAQRKAYDEASAALRTAADHRRQGEALNWRPLFNLGLVLARQKRWDDAADALEAIVDDSVESHRARLLLARILRCGGRHLEAIERLGEPLDWGRWHSRSQELLGLIHDDLGNPMQALVFWREAARLDPALGRVHAHMARRFLQESEIDEAAASIERALEIQKDRPETWLIAGEVALAQEDFDQAESAFSMAIELKESLSEARYWLGRTHLERGELVGAVRQWERLDAADSSLAPRLKRRIDRLQGE